jgi:hypothetical protein
MAGLFKTAGTILSAMGEVATKTATTSVKLLDTVETSADVVNLWADTAHKASELTSVQMLDEIRYENSIRAEELKAKLASMKVEA